MVVYIHTSIGLGYLPGTDTSPWTSRVWCCVRLIHPSIPAGRAVGCCIWRYHHLCVYYTNRDAEAKEVQVHHAWHMLYRLIIIAVWIPLLFMSI